VSLGDSSTGNQTRRLPPARSIAAAAMSRSGRGSTAPHPFSTGTSVPSAGTSVGTSVSFSVGASEEVDRVIAAYREGKPLGGEVRRMVK
jgi:hypothetical protein